MAANNLAAILNYPKIPLTEYSCLFISSIVSRKSHNKFDYSMEC